MANVKTTVSIPDTLVGQADKAAQELNLSRSGLFSRAIEEFLRRRRIEELRRQINEAYADGPDEDERGSLIVMQRCQREMMDRDEW